MKNAENTQVKLLKVNEVAKILQTSPKTVRQYINYGQLQALRLPNKGGYRIRLNDLDHFLDGLQIA